MQKINVAIIDSGVNEEEISGNCSINYAYSCKKNNYRDAIGHGTNIIQTILSHENRIKLYIFKIFDKKLSCDLEELLIALNKIYLEYPFINLVNMSLGIPRDNPKLKYYCERLTNRGIKLIAAYNNNHNTKGSFPAEYPFVYGVEAEVFYNCFEYSLSPENNVKLYGYLPYFLIEATHITCKANSFAAAHFSGILSKELIDQKSDGIIDEKAFVDYQNKYGDFSWINKVIVIDDREQIIPSGYEKKKVKLVGICKLADSNLYIINYKEKENSDYDTLVIDNYYSKNIKAVLDCILFNMKNKKNVFCVTGFGIQINSFLYLYSKMNGCNFYIKYIC